MRVVLASRHGKILAKTALCGVLAGVLCMGFSPSCRAQLTLPASPVQMERKAPSAARPSGLVERNRTLPESPYARRHDESQRRRHNPDVVVAEYDSTRITPGLSAPVPAAPREFFADAPPPSPGSSGAGFLKLPPGMQLGALSPAAGSETANSPPPPPPVAMPAAPAAAVPPSSPAPVSSPASAAPPAIVAKNDVVPPTSTVELPSAQPQEKTQSAESPKELPPLSTVVSASPAAASTAGTTPSEPSLLNLPKTDRDSGASTTAISALQAKKTAQEEGGLLSLSAAPPAKPPTPTAAAPTPKPAAAIAAAPPPPAPPPPAPAKQETKKNAKTTAKPKPVPKELARSLAPATPTLLAPSHEPQAAPVFAGEKPAAQDTLSEQSRAILDRLPAKLETAPASRNSKKTAPGHVSMDRESAVNDLFPDAYEDHTDRGISIEVRRADVNVNYELEKAYDALIAGESDEAISVYQQLVKQDSTNTMALFGLATAYHRRGQLDLARPLYGRLLSLAPGNREALNNFLALVGEESPRDALEQLAKLEAKNPDFSPIPAQMAQVYQKAGQYEDAAKKMRRAITLSPENLKYRYNLAVILDRMGQKQEAASLYQQLLTAQERGEAIPGDKRQIEERLTFLRSNSLL